MNAKTYSELATDELSAKIKSAVAALRHKGETGKNIESIVRKALRPYIPNIFGMETGFVRTLERPNWQSNQIDVLFTRQDVCHPLAVFPDSKVYPIESIIGFMEVTKSITKAKLLKDFKKVADLKHMVQRRFRLPTTVARQLGLLKDSPPPSTEQELLRERISRTEVTMQDLEPRFFYFAFSTSWKSIQAICQNLATVGKKLGIHLHGMMILDKGYFKHKPTDDPATAYQISYITDPKQAYIAFVYDIIDSLQTFDPIPPTAAIPIDLYNLMGVEYKYYTSAEA